MTANQNFLSVDTAVQFNPKTSFFDILSRGVYMHTKNEYNIGGGGGVNRFSDRRISQKKLSGFRIWRMFYTDFGSY